MHTSTLPRHSAWLLTVLLAACGGGGGGGADPATAAPPAPTVETPTVRALSAVPAASVPAQWPDNVKTVTVTRAGLLSATELAQTGNPPRAIHIQLWYLDKDQQRQTVAMLTLQQLDALGGSLRLPNIPRGVSSLRAEVYTLRVDAQQTLATKEIPA